MVMRVQIPDELARDLVKRAEATGTEPEKVAVAAIRRQLDADEQLEQLLTPVRDAFQSSGLTEEEAVELFEAEKHEMRRERRETGL
jgi:hypothetical protein